MDQHHTCHSRKQIRNRIIDREEEERKRKLDEIPVTLYLINFVNMIEIQKSEADIDINSCFVYVWERNNGFNRTDQEIFPFQMLISKKIKVWDRTKRISQILEIFMNIGFCGFIERISRKFDFFENMIDWDYFRWIGSKVREL